ncbi:hypothetical protein [Massilia rhizosphaerae]|uniref:hypothetical protein n=1 Tax=Massilia rhizosphaerae TaxID=2784389 RepID=UPI0018DE7898|nr:hypothetical protein [Massilia rhizosphaerae]
MLNKFARGLLTVILSVMLVGFGVCGAYGTFGGLAGVFGPRGEGSDFAPMLIGFGLVGLGIAWICWLAVADLWRKRPPGDR